MFEEATPIVEMTPREEPQRLGTPIEPRRLIAAVSRARRGLLYATLGGALLGGLGASFLPRTYQSRGVLVVDRAGESDPHRIQTLAESVKLPTILDRTRTILNLHTETEVLARRIDVDRTDNANLLTVVTSAAKAEEAQALAATVIDVFVSDQLALEKKRLVEARRAKMKETEAARTAFDDAQKKWDAFRAEHAVVDPSAELTAAIERLAKLETEADLASVASSAEGAREEALRKSLGQESANVVLSEREARPVDQKLGELRAERKMLEGRLSSDHPRMLALEAQIAALQSASGSSHATIVERNVGLNPGVPALQHAISTALADRAAAKRKGIALEAALATATAEVKRLATVGGSASPLVVELALARTRLDGALAAEAGAREALRGAVPGVRVVAPPTLPEKPFKSLRRPIAIASPFLALFMALAFVLVRELARLRLVAPSEIAFWSRCPVIMSSSWPAVGTADVLRVSLREEIEDRDALVVPFGEAERAWVKELGLEAFEGEPAGPELRRAARRADRVIVVIGSGNADVFSIAQLTTCIGRDDAELVVVGLGPALANVADRFVHRRVS